MLPDRQNVSSYLYIHHITAALYFGKPYRKWILVLREVDTRQHRKEPDEQKSNL